MIFGETSLLRWLVNHDADQAGEPRLQWTNMPESWGVFVLILVVALLGFAVIWLYRREISTCPRPMKFLMAGLRLTVMLLLVVLWLQPSVYYQQVTEIKPTIVMLRDGSLSIGQTDKFDDSAASKQLAKMSGESQGDLQAGLVTRERLINRIVDRNPQIVEKLIEKGHLRVVDFDTGSKQVALISSSLPTGGTDAPTNDNEVDTSNDRQIPALIADGLGTDISRAINDSLGGNARVSAVVLVTEGQHNGNEDPVVAAATAAERDVPIFTVGAGDPTPPRNLSVNEVYVREKAFPDEPFEIEAVIQSTRQRDVVNLAEVEVQLIQQAVNPASGQLGPPQRVDQQTVNLPEGGGRMRVDFSRVLRQPGKYVFTIQMPQLEGESDVADNSRSSSEIEVVDARVNVLLVSGLPSWDYQQVARLLQRDSSIRLSCWLQSLDQSRPQEGDNPITRLPQTMEELSAYNVVILMDPDPKDFSKKWISTLKKFCKTNFGGVMFVAGPQFSGEFVTMNRLKDIRDLLPVRFGDSQSIEETEVLSMARDFSAIEMLPVKYNMDHPVMSFRSSTTESAEIWDLMPNIYWNFPVDSPKPTARVLLERGQQPGSGENQPLLVASRYGSGSVLYMGFQETYRWRRLGVQAQYFDRFWIQAVRFLVESRSMQGARRGFLDIEAKQFELGQRVRFVGRVLDSDFEPSQAPSHLVPVRGRDGLTQQVILKRVPNSQGSYEGSFNAVRLGPYEATLTITGESDESLIQPIDFRVVPPSAEAGADWLNEKLLRQIAKESGGQYLPLGQLADLPDLIPNAIERVEFNSPPRPLWDCSQFLRWFFYLLPVALLSLEWVLRKYFKLL